MRTCLLTGALSTVLLIGGGQAFAADLGGNCCADLEERIAELEATTARKGNRKVSLTITGWVSSQLYWFDDGIESNLYLVDNNNDLSTNVRFTGSAKISPGWTAGYALLIHTNPPSSLNANEDWNATKTTNGGNWSLQVENSYWFIKSDTLGMISVGKQSLGNDNIAVFTDFSGTLFPANTVATFDGFNARVVVNGLDSGARWNAAAFYCEHPGIGISNDCAGLRLNGVRYDTPTFAGFSMSASWGEDDYWDIGLRHSGENGGFKYAFSVGYSETTDNAIVAPGTNDNQFFQFGGMVKHLASGLWIHGTWGEQFFDDGPNHPPHPDAIGWYLKAGWTTKFVSLGNTTFWGEFGRNQDAFSNLASGSGVMFGSQIVSTEANRISFGVMQEIDAAAMSLWAKYSIRQLDFVLQDGRSGSADDLNMWLAGAVIFF